MMVTRAASVDNSSGFWQDGSKNALMSVRNGSGALTGVINSSGTSYITGGSLGNTVTVYRRNTVTKYGDSIPND